MRNVPAAILTAAVLALLTGCTSVWDQSYQPYLTAPALRSGEQVTVREIPWQRMQAALQEQKDIASSSDIHWQEWTDEQRLEANGKLLKALQISDDPRNVRIVGVSSFRTTDKVRPWDGELESFAKSRGAHYAVWANRYLGKAETIVTHTVWSDTTDYITYEDSTGENRRASRRRSTSSDVPLVVEKDETGYTAFFLRVE